MALAHGRHGIGPEQENTRNSMPNRILKQTICTSPNLNAVSMGAENFFYRLIVQCDDFGRYHATPSILRGHCYPLKIDEISNDNIAGWVEELCQADILIVYDSGRYLQLTNWSKHQTKRADKSKFPDPNPDEIICKQVQADESNGKPILTYSRTGTRTGTGTGDSAADAAEPAMNQPEDVKHTDHPAIAVWRETHDGKYPAKATWPGLIQAVGEQPADLARWRQVITAYIGCGWNPANLSGMLDWYTRNETPHASRANGNGKPAASKAEKIRQQQDVWDAKQRARGLPV